MNKPLYEQIGNRVKKLRSDAGFSQDDLAEKSEISTYYVGEIERGVKRVSVEVLYKISGALNITLKELFDFTEL